MDENDFYYYMDGRNARRPTRPPAPVPISRQVIVAPPPAQLVPSPQAAAPVAQPPMQQPYGMPAYPPFGGPQAPYGMAPVPYREPAYAQPAYAQPYGMQPYGMQPYGAPAMPYVGGMYGETPSVLQAMFGKITLGQLVELGTQVYAAAQKLPTAPTAVPDVGDNFANLITYQSALAGHAKRDEQVRTLGSLIGKLVG